jgi:hypothetical protein
MIERAKSTMADYASVVIGVMAGFIFGALTMEGVPMKAITMTVTQNGEPRATIQGRSFSAFGAYGDYTSVTTDEPEGPAYGLDEWLAEYGKAHTTEVVVEYQGSIIATALCAERGIASAEAHTVKVYDRPANWKAYEGRFGPTVESIAIRAQEAERVGEDAVRIDDAGGDHGNL